MDISSKKRLSVGDAFWSALSIINNNKLSLINLFLPFCLVALLGVVLGWCLLLSMLSFLGTSGFAIGLFGFIVTIGILAQSFWFGCNRIALALLDDKPVSSSVFFFSPQELWRQFFAICLNILMVALGVICLIVPGLYLWIKFDYYDLVLADNLDIGAIEALKTSSEIKTDRFWQVVRFILLSGILIGLLSTIIAVLVKINIVFCLLYPILALLGFFMRAHVYRQLQPKHDV